LVSLIGKERVNLRFLSRQLARGMKKLLLCLLVFLALSVVLAGVRAQPAGTWTTEAPLPIPKADLPGVSYDGLLYVFGGYQYSSTGGTSDVFAYDPSSNSWTQEASMNVATWGSAAAVYNGVAYVFGGADGANDQTVQAYNFATNSWTTKNDMPYDLGGQGLEAVTVGSLIYVFSGSNNPQSTYSYAYSYNPSTDTYTRLANVPYGTRWATCAAVNVDGQNQIYIMGGFDSSTDNEVNTMYYYTPANNEWTYAGTTPYGAYGGLRDDPVIDGLIYWGYGQASSLGTFYSSLYSYDPNTATWSSALPSGSYPRDGVACGAINGELYVVGGRNSYGVPNPGDPIPGLHYNEQFNTGYELSANISPTQVTMDVGQSTTFTATASGGSGSYSSYQWYVGTNEVQNAASNSYTYSPSSSGSYSITATVTDSSGYVSAQSSAASVRVNSALVAPTASASKGTVDQGQTSSLTSTAVSTGTSPYTYQWLEKAPGGSYVHVGTNSTSYSFATSTSTTTGAWSFELQVTDSASTPVVVTSTAVSVTVNVAPSVSISPTSWTMDIGQSKTFTATPSGGSGSYTSYQWYVGGSAQSGATASTFNYSLTSSGSYSITVTVNDTLGATSAQSSASTVTVKSALVAPTASASKSTVDQGQTSSLTSTAMSTGTSPYTYQWLEKAPGGSYVDIGTNSTSYSFATSGSTAIGVWSFELQVTDSASTPVVVTSNAVSVTVNAAPTISISPTSWTMDIGQSKTFTATATGGSGSYTSYQWYVGGSAQSGATASTFNYSPASTGSYSITVTVNDSLGATSAQSSASTVTVNASPTVSITPVGPLTMDVGQVQGFTATASGGSGSLSYQWYLDSVAVGTNSTSYSYTAAGTSHSITCKVTDSASTPVTSPASNTVSVTVNSALVAPTASASKGTVDQGQTSSLTSTAVSTGTSPYTYQWLEKAPGGSYVDVGTNSTSYSFATSTSTTTGAWSFELQVTDSASTPVVVTSAPVSVTVNTALVAPTVTPTPGTVDQGQTSSLTSTALSTGTSPYAYQWLEKAPGGSYSSISGAISSSYSFATSGSTATGVWSFELQVTDSASTPVVVTSNAVSVTVNAAPTVSVTPTSWTMDVGQSEIFTATPSGGSGSYTSYQWYVGGTAQSGQISSTFNYSPASSGAYSITVTVNDSLGATSPQSSAASVTVNSALTVIVSPSSWTMDVGQVQLFTSTSSGGSGSLSYQWYYTNGTAIMGATTSTLTYKANSTGTYYIYLNVTDSVSFTAQSNTATINVYSTLVASVSPTNTILYYGQSQTFSASVLGGAPSYNYQWYLNGTLVTGANSATWMFTPSADGNSTIYVIVTDSLSDQDQSNTATVSVYSVNLVLTVNQGQSSLTGGQTVTLEVDVFNQFNPSLQTSLTLTVTGPSNYGYYDTQPVNVTANSVGEYTFCWIIPSVAGTYNVEVGFAPAQLTAYDTACLQVNSAPAVDPKPLGAVAGLSAWIGGCAVEMWQGTLVVVLGLILGAALVHVRNLSLVRSQKLIMSVSVVNANGYRVSGGSDAGLVESSGSDLLP
jgi:uncharacterized membrane protein YebE (DUF533 family)